MKMKSLLFLQYSFIRVEIKRLELTDICWKEFWCMKIKDGEFAETSISYVIGSMNIKFTFLHLLVSRKFKGKIIICL
jgi:hypothetical protein